VEDEDLLRVSLENHVALRRWTGGLLADDEGSAELKVGWLTYEVVQSTGCAERDKLAKVADRKVGL
jgi:hypothetical protein